MRHCFLGNQIARLTKDLQPLGPRSCGDCCVITAELPHPALPQPLRATFGGLVAGLDHGLAPISRSTSIVIIQIVL